MPTYDYACSACGPFEAFRALSARNAPAACPACASPSPRTLGGAASLALMDGATRRAIETNERASHAPRMSGELRDAAHASNGGKSHPRGCGCCSGTKRGATVTAPNGNKAFPSKRPWMISH